ncbi:MAG: LysR family transcriptional regulator [Lachnospiraceae bacterium]|nr:LysR family transcriptional regulator [Lachnospiraceae bacterium]
MNYNKLKYFYIAAKNLNYTKAASELYVSQSAISRHIKELEEDFGVQLFVRTNRDLILTDAGKVLYDKANEIFSKESDIYSAVRAAANQESSELRIGTMGIRFAYTIPMIANEMINVIPNLKVSMQRFNWDTICPALYRKEIQVGLRLRLGEMKEENLAHLVLDQDTPSMIVHKTHRLADKTSVKMKEFEKDNFLILSKAESSIPFSHSKGILKKNQMKPKSIIECASPEELMMMVNSGAGVALMSKFALLDQFPDIRTIDVDEHDLLWLELIWLKDSESPLLHHFVQKMEECYSNITRQQQ